MNATVFLSLILDGVKFHYFYKNEEFSKVHCKTIQKLWNVIDFIWQAITLINKYLIQQKSVNIHDAFDFQDKFLWHLIWEELRK